MDGYSRGVHETKTLRAVVVGLLFATGCASESIDAERTARDATLGVRVAGCGPRTGFGTATMIDDEIALTAAHVVAGPGQVTVVDDTGTQHPATVVWFDPEQDLAALRLASGVAAPIQFYDGVVEAGEAGLVGLERDADTDRAVTVDEIEVLRRVNVATTDIYLDVDVIRPGFEIAGSIEPGDSGAVVLIDGAAAGVIWARSTQRAERAWVVNIPASLRDQTVRNALVEPAERGTCTR